MVKFFLHTRKFGGQNINFCTKWQLSRKTINLGNWSPGKVKNWVVYVKMSQNIKSEKSFMFLHMSKILLSATPCFIKTYLNIKRAWLIKCEKILQLFLTSLERMSLFFFRRGDFWDFIEIFGIFWDLGFLRSIWDFWGILGLLEKCTRITEFDWITPRRNWLRNGWC